MKAKAAIVLLIGCLFVVGTWAQEKDEKTVAASSASTEIRNKFYRLDYVLRELDGSKEVSRRAYTVMARTDGSYKALRTGTRVPIATGVTTGATTNTQFQYIDVGVNIDTQAHENANGLWLEVTAELSSIADGDAPTHAGGPMVRQWKGSGNVAVTPGKPTVVFSGDDATSNRKFELMVTATQLR